MLRAERAPAQVVSSEPAGARAHAPPPRPPPTGWSRQEAARALPQAADSALEAGGGGGGKVPVTSGSRESGREGRGRGRRSNR